MIICICNGINEKKVNKAVKSGLNNWADVHKFYDCKPKCGKCRCEIVEKMNNLEEEILSTNSLLGASTA